MSFLQEEIDMNDSEARRRELRYCKRTGGQIKF